MKKGIRKNCKASSIYYENIYCGHLCKEQKGKNMHLFFNDFLPCNVAKNVRKKKLSITILIRNTSDMSVPHCGV